MREKGKIRKKWKNDKIVDIKGMKRIKKQKIKKI